MAGGNGKRINATTLNKVTLPILGKPMVLYGVELFENFTDEIIIVVGAFAESVRKALKGKAVKYAHQKERLGTADAVRAGLTAITIKPQYVLIGYGDHMMFYKKETIKKLIDHHIQEKAVLTSITTMHSKPDDLAWGRITRNGKGHIMGIIEQKDATPEERKIEELNAGFYCVNYDFLVKSLPLIEKSPVTNEYYITDLVKIANVSREIVTGMVVPYSEVGLGVNTNFDLTNATALLTNTS